MIMMHALWFLIAVAVFFILRRQRPIIRLVVSGLVFVLLSMASIYAFYKAAGEPLDGYVPVSEEILERGAMTQEEWEAYKNSLAEEEADPEKEE